VATEYAALVFKVDSNELAVADRRLEDVEKQSGKTEKATHGVKDGFDSAAGAARTLSRGIQLVVASMAVREVIKYADAWTNVENRLRLVTDSTAMLESAQRNLFNIAQDTRQSFESTAQLYQRMASSADALGISYDRMLNITKIVNQTMAISGASAQESAAAIIQLGQALGSGALRGDEFRSIAEQAPRLRDALVQGLGLDGVGALRELAEQGKLTSEVVITALESQGYVINSEFGGMEKTVGQATTVMTNSFMKLVGQINEVTGATGAATEAMGEMSSFLDGISEKDVAQAQSLLAGQFWFSLARAIRDASGAASDFYWININSGADIDDAATRIVVLREALAEMYARSSDATQGTFNFRAQVQFLNSEIERTEEVLRKPLEQLRAFQRLTSGIAINPFTGLPSAPLAGLGGDGYASPTVAPEAATAEAATAVSTPFDSVGDTQAAVEQSRLDMLAQRDADELIMANDHAQMLIDVEQARIDRIQEMDDEALASKLDGYSVLHDALEGFGEDASRSMARVIMHGGDAKDVVTSLAASISQNLIESMIAFGIQQAVTFGQSQAFAAAQTVASGAQAATIGAFWAVPAAMASLATFGGNAAPASAGIAATVAVAEGLTVVGGREIGGQVLPNNSYLVGERGPEVITMGSTAGNVSQVPQPQQQGAQAQELVITQNIHVMDDKGVRAVLGEQKDFIEGLVRNVLGERGVVIA